MFLPPNASWVSNSGGGEEDACGLSWTHGDRVDLDRINASYAAARAAGLRTLSYFNLFHFGQNVPEPLPPPPSPPSAGAWVDSGLFLAQVREARAAEAGGCVFTVGCLSCPSAESIRVSASSVCLRLAELYRA